MSTEEKIKVFYLETKRNITFYSYQNQDVMLQMNKTEDNYKAFNKILSSNKYEFIKLIK